MNNKSFIAISFASGFTSPNIPIVSFYQGNKQLNFILDSGSDRNVIDASVLKDLEYEKLEDRENIRLTGINGSQQTQLCRISFTAGEESYQEEFLVSETLEESFKVLYQAHAIPLHGMIGSNFLRKNNLVLDFVNMVAYNKDK